LHPAPHKPAANSQASRDRKGAEQNFSMSPVSRHTLSRFGPIHCGQSVARLLTEIEAMASTNNTSRIVAPLKMTCGEMIQTISRDFIGPSRYEPCID
jgi:hypothetical protein